MHRRGFFDFLAELTWLCWEITKAGANTTFHMAEAYLRAIKKLAFYTVIVLVVSATMMFLGVHFQSPVLLASSVVLVGLVSIAWSILWGPVDIIRAYFHRLKRPIDAITKRVSNVITGTVVLATYLFTVPVWNKPGLIPLAMTTFVAIFFVYSEKGAIDKKALRSKVIFLAIFLTITFYYPRWNERAAEILAQVYGQEEVVKAEPLLREAQTSSPVVPRDKKTYEVTLELPE